MFYVVFLRCFYVWLTRSLVEQAYSGIVGGGSDDEGSESEVKDGNAIEDEEDIEGEDQEGSSCCEVLNDQAGRAQGHVQTMLE